MEQAYTTLGSMYSAQSICIPIAESRREIVYRMRRIQQTARFLLAALVGLGIVFVMTGTVAAKTRAPDLPAHASVLSAIPAIGSTIAQPPTAVTVFTAENINPDPKVSNLFVYGPSGEATSKLISQGNAQVSFTNPKEMSVNIKPNSGYLNGVYVVQWITKSALDGDPDSGAFIFTVKSGAAGTATPSATATSTGQGTTPTPTSTSGNGGTPAWLAAVIGLVAMLIGIGAGLGLGRRRPAPAASSGSSLGAIRRGLENERDK